MEINRFLDELVLEYHPLNHVQCIALLEHSKTIDNCQVIHSVLSVITGQESILFRWKPNDGCFQVSSEYSTSRLNSKIFFSYLQQYAKIGSLFRQMFDFTECEFFRGQTFQAFQAVLQNILGELMERVLWIRKRFDDNRTKLYSKLSLLALDSYLDNEENGNLLLSIRNLFQIYQDVNQELKLSTSDHICGIQIERYYCRQVMAAIYQRISTPHRRIRSIAYTMLYSCIRPLFRSIEQLLLHLSSLDKLHSFEFPLSSTFPTDSDLYCHSYSHHEMNHFWNDFLFLSKEFAHIPLFGIESLDSLIEAIKCSFALRKNQLPLEANIESVGELFRKNLILSLTRYVDLEANFDLETRHVEQEFVFGIPGLAFPKMKRNLFRCFEFPTRTVLDSHSIIAEALNESLEKLSKPIITEFLLQIRPRYLQLFAYYTDFYLCQQSQHILAYIYFLFPSLESILADRNFRELERLLRTIHRNHHSEFASVLEFFQPNYSSIVEDSLDSSLFANIYFLPSFDHKLNRSLILSKSAQNFHSFWPLTHLFNPKITELFNQLFQFLLRLRYFQYLIGNKFLLSGQFRRAELPKQVYLFRFRLVNLLFQFGRQIEYRLKVLVKQTIENFHQAENFEAFLNQHQRFLIKLSQISQCISKSRFVHNLFRTVAKFNRINTKSLNQSMCKSFETFDQINQSDFFDSMDL